MESLAAIQKALNVPKNRYNKFGDYNYRSCEDILDAVRPLLGKCILTLTDKVVKLGDDRYYIVATATFMDGEKSIVVEAAAREPNTPRKKMDESQTTGAASSYARKYALNGLFCLSDVQDADSMKPHNGAGSTPPPQSPAPSIAHSDSGSTSDSQVPFDKPVPPKQGPDEWPAPTAEQRTMLNLLRDFYKAQLPDRKMVPNKLLKLCQLHLARFPNSLDDCELCKRYIKAAEVME